jgi:hypothetical protein
MAAGGCLLVLLLVAFLGGPPAARRTPADLSPHMMAKRLAAVAADPRAA